MIVAGIDVARLNFSHDVIEKHQERAWLLRERAAWMGREVGLLADLQGPKIRIEGFREGKILLEEGARFVLDAQCPPDAGTQDCVGISYKSLPDDVDRGDTLLLDDGQIALWAEEVTGSQIRTKVVVGGLLSSHKGINRQGGGLSAPALTDKDRNDIRVAASMGVDYLAVSFPRSAADINEARELLRAAGGHGAVVAKIERAEAVEGLEEIIGAADAVMIARGDLGVEIGDAALPPVQKRIIERSRAMNRAVITATQMMESMISHPIPTRAEVFDVANAVLDGTDAVMLSAETAAGRFPAQAVEAMDRICREAEKQRLARVSDHRINSQFGRVDEAIAMATMYTANHLGVRAIAALTESGATALWMSRISSGIPIYALSRQRQTLRKVTLFRGVSPVFFDPQSTDHPVVNRAAIDELESRAAIADGDLVIITKGDLIGSHGGTNAMKIVRVGDLVMPQD